MASTVACANLRIIDPHLISNAKSFARVAVTLRATLPTIVGIANKAANFAVRGCVIHLPPPAMSCGGAMGNPDRRRIRDQVGAIWGKVGGVELDMIKLQSLISQCRCCLALRAGRRSAGALTAQPDRSFQIWSRCRCHQGPTSSSTASECRIASRHPRRDTQVFNPN